MDEQNKFAYVTLLSTTDYLPAVLVLAESLRRTQTQYPLVVGVPADIVFQVNQPLKKANCIIEVIHRLEYNKETHDKWPGLAVLNTASKIELFGLDQWGKLVYIDADCLVLSNMDDLFHYPSGSMVKYEENQWGFTALMVFSPKDFYLPYYKILIQTIDCFDGDLLGRLWYPVHSNPNYQIPAYYLMRYDNCQGTAQEWQEIKAIHFVNNPKPWVQATAPKGSAAWYWNYYQSLLRSINN